MPAIEMPLIKFFQDLEANNQLAWFEENQHRYEAGVKGPVQALMESVLPALRKLEPQLPVSAVDAVMRMNPDGRQGLVPMVRANLAPPPAAMEKGARKRDLPGYYVAISAKELHIGGGLFSLDRDGQTLVRKHIKANSAEFMALAAAPDFVDKFGGIQGEQLRRLGQEMDSLRLIIPEIANKEFYYVRGFRVMDHIGNAGIGDLLMEHFAAIAPLNAFFQKALQGEEKSELQFGSGFFRLRDKTDDSEE